MDTISKMWYPIKKSKEVNSMKLFFKSMFISLLFGIPLVAVVLFFLYKNMDQPLESTIPSESIQQLIASNENDSNNEYQALNQPDELDSQEYKSSVTLSFAGDVHFSELALTAYDKSGLSGLADQAMISHMQNADLFILNNEFVFSTRGEAMADKQYTLRTDPDYVKILQEMGTDVVAVANNHILDFGRDAFMDTLDTLKTAEIDYAGGGKNIEEASAPVIRTIGGQTFAIFSATRVSPSGDWYAGSSRSGIMQTYDAKTLNNAIKEADETYDHTIVFVHWGVERSVYPEEYQRTLAKGYIDAGADLIIGCHPHVLQGFEFYKGVPICYSLGNYLFGNRTGETLLLNAHFTENNTLSIELIPCERINGVLTLIEDPADLFHNLTDLSFGAAISQKGILIEGF